MSFKKSLDDRFKVLKVKPTTAHKIIDQEPACTCTHDPHGFWKPVPFPKQCTLYVMSKCADYPWSLVTW